MKNSHKKLAVLLTFSIRVLNTTCGMDQALMRELLTFVKKNRIVREDDIKIFIKLSMCKVIQFFKRSCWKKGISSIKGTSFERKREKGCCCIQRVYFLHGSRCCKRVLSLQ